jgi:hypothetical protein
VTLPARILIQQQAACRGRQDVFLSSRPGGQGNKQKKQICDTCPVIELCLYDALVCELGTELKTRYYVYGGCDPQERYDLDRRLGEQNILEWHQQLVDWTSETQSGYG